MDLPGNLSRSNVSSLDLTPPAPEPVIIHPGVVIVMIQLLPSLKNEDNPQLALVLQCYIAEVIKSLVRRYAKLYPNANFTLYFKFVSILLNCISHF